MAQVIDRQQRYFFYNKGYIVFEEVVNVDSLSLKKVDSIRHVHPWIAKEKLSSSFLRGKLSQVICGLWNVDKAEVIYECGIKLWTVSGSLEPLAQKKAQSLIGEVENLCDLPIALGTIWLCIQDQPSASGHESLPKKRGQISCIDASCSLAPLLESSGSYIGWIITKEGGIQSLRDEELFKQAQASSVKITHPLFS